MTDCRQPHISISHYYFLDLHVNVHKMHNLNAGFENRQSKKHVTMFGRTNLQKRGDC